MTKPQRIALQADWWPRACRAQGWKASNRDLRLRVCMWILSLPNPTQLDLLAAINSDRQPPRWLESTSEITDQDEITHLKKCLGMLADHLGETREVGHLEIDHARRKRDVIRNHLKCLALYEAHPRRFLAALINDMFNQNRPVGTLTIKDLDDMPRIYINRKTKAPQEGPSQLLRLVMRLAAIVNDRRNQNLFAPGWQHLEGPYPLTGHQMKIAAGADCDCSECRRASQIPARVPTLENWADFDPESELASNPF